MQKLSFQTTINCTNCVAKVAPHLDKLSEVKSWSVDTAHSQKILTIETTLSTDKIGATIDALGFEALPIESS
jgi:copper chaperone CopZ